MNVEHVWALFCTHGWIHDKCRRHVCCVYVRVIKCVSMFALRVKNMFDKHVLGEHYFGGRHMFSRSKHTNRRHSSCIKDLFWLFILHEMLTSWAKEWSNKKSSMHRFPNIVFPKHSFLEMVVFQASFSIHDLISPQ